MIRLKRIATESYRRRPLRVCVVVLSMMGLVLSTIVAVAGPSAAIAIETYSGSTGIVSRNGVMTTVTYIPGGPPAYASSMVFATDGVTARSVSSSRGTQTIFFYYQLQQISNGRWTAVATTNGDYGYAAGSGAGSVRGPSWQVQLNRTPSFAATYRMVAYVMWFDTATNRTIGGETVIPNAAGENVCNSRLRPCTAYTNAVVI